MIERIAEKMKDVYSSLWLLFQNFMCICRLIIFKDIYSQGKFKCKASVCIHNDQSRHYSPDKSTHKRKYHKYFLNLSNISLMIGIFHHKEICIRCIIPYSKWIEYRIKAYICCFLIDHIMKRPNRIIWRNIDRAHIYIELST